MAKWKDASSLDILRETGQAVTGSGWTINNVDATVVAEAPKIAPWRESMIEMLSAALGVATSAVWVKGTSTDGLGWEGQKKGIGAMAVVLIERSDDLVA